VIAVREPVDVAGMADHHRGDNGSDREDVGRVHRDFLGNTARNEVEQQRMQPTRAAVPGPTQIPVRLREQPEHDRVICPFHRLHVGCACGNRDREPRRARVTP
jgi:hypothetical protein